MGQGQGQSRASSPTASLMMRLYCISPLISRVSRAHFSLSFSLSHLLIILITGLLSPSRHEERERENPDDSLRSPLFPLHVHTPSCVLVFLPFFPVVLSLDCQLASLQ